MADRDFVVSADGHIIEPVDLFVTRLPKHLRDRAVWEEEFTVDPPVAGGARVFRRLHTPGYSGWTVGRYHQTDGRTPEGDPGMILEDMDADGIDLQVMYPNLSMFGLYSDDHELSIAHARVYNDWVAETFLPFSSRLAPAAPIPLTDVADAVVEVERAAALGFKAVLLPATPPRPYWSPDNDPVWAAIQGAGMQVFVHTATGGVKTNDPEATTLKVVMGVVDEVNQPMTPKLASRRMVTQCIYGTFEPQRVIIELVAGGVPERFPDLHFVLVEFNAHWFASLIGAMDKAWTAGTGQDRDWWIGTWDDSRPSTDQPTMARLFSINEQWLHPLRPSEYVKRQFHVSFQDDPVAVASRHITGVPGIVWGSDYPHAEGSFRRSQDLIAEQFVGVPDAERRAMLGGTLAGILGYATV